jgi:site-specific DNA-methyltransferase (adenine-specific)
MDLKVINGNNIDILKTYPDNYFDAVVTDPPYGLGKEPNAEELMKDWIEHGYHEISGSGFMGKEWDAFVPQPIFWKEVYRVLKPGGHILSFFGTRTYDWGVMSMRFAGFEVRDCIQWLYGSGFPKSHNISKALDKMEGAEREVVGQSQDILKKQAKDLKLGKRKILESLNNGASERNNGFVNVSADITAPATEAAKQWDGWGTALKPANEPIVLARKPLEKGLSVAENILKWGVGGINIDASRIGNENRSYKGMSSNIPSGAGTFRDDNWKPKDIEVNVSGRFPANIILTHHEDCECKGTKKVKAISGGTNAKRNSNYMSMTMGYKDADGLGGYGDAEGNETVEDWDCHEDCPIRILDEQSLSMGMHSAGNKRQKNVISQYDSSSYHAPIERQMNRFGDKGGASRFFYVAKASKAERNKGLDEFEEKQTTGGGGGVGDYIDDVNSSSGKYGSEKAPNKNFHPTVKPIKLMQYLVKMITPPNGIVLDPFCGSGTTGVACKIDGFQFIGLEQDPEYTKIAEARISNYKDDSIKKKEDQLTLF